MRFRVEFEESMTTIPKIRLDIESIATRAEAIPTATVFDSNIPSTYIIRSHDEAVVITRKSGYLRINIDDIDSLISELENIKDKIWEK